MDLSDILACFNAPIKEEQAWAVCHLCGKYLQCKESKEKPLPIGTKSIFFDKDGYLSIKGKICEDETIIVNNLGLILFAALDYGLTPEEEQVLSEDLDFLISSMTKQFPSGDDETDEGYVDATIDTVVNLCEKHLPPSTDADNHYQAVCRALVHEAVELKLFLSKIASANECLQKLSAHSDLVNEQTKEKNETTCLNHKEWAHIWLQVLDELRQGVTKLRRVEKQTRMSVEFELTPYEIMMEDIRQKKYTLKKVTDGQLSPHLKKTAHDIILDFIRSRPSLSPAHERVLAPIPPRSKSLHEMLLEQIQSQCVTLKHVDVTSSRPCSFKRSISDGSGDSSHRQRRRLKPSFLDDDDDSIKSFESDSDVDDVTLYISSEIDGTGDFSSFYLSNDNTTASSSGTSGVSSSFGGNHLSTHNYPAKKLIIPPHLTPRKRVLPLELLPSPPRTPMSSSPRKNSFLSSVFSSFRTSRGVRRSQSILTDATTKKSYSEQVFNGWDNQKMKKQDDEDLPSLTSTPLPSSELRRTFSERRIQPKNKFLSRASNLQLSLKEIMHIREVLSRAQLEKYQFSNETYQALKNEKLCFTCRTRRFNIFLWPYTCRICKRKVCGRCVKKIRFPLIHSTESLLFSISPALAPLTVENRDILRQTLSKEQLASSAELPSFNSRSRGTKLDICLDCHVILATAVITKVCT